MTAATGLETAAIGQAARGIHLWAGEVDLWAGEVDLGVAANDPETAVIDLVPLPNDLAQLPIDLDAAAVVLVTAVIDPGIAVVDLVAGEVDPRVAVVGLEYWLPGACPFFCVDPSVCLCVRREWLQAMAQQAIQAEFDRFVGANPYQRTAARRGYRNGTYPRALKTRVGSMLFAVPRDRAGLFQPSLFARYERSEQALVLAMVEMYFHGVSTRKVSAIAEQLGGTSISASEVSALTRKLDGAIVGRIEPAWCPASSEWRHGVLALPSF